MSAAGTLAELTTLRLGGPAREVVDAGTPDEVVEAVREADAAGTPVLVVGGGSNLVVGDAGFEGRVVHVHGGGPLIEDASACAGASMTAFAGVVWDDVVAAAVEGGWVGVEALSGIPGSTGATPVQNVGAYGQEVGDTLSVVRLWDRLEGRRRMLAVGDLQLGYRTSRIKRERLPEGAPGAGVPGADQRWIVLQVDLQLRPGTVSAPVRYAELARALGVEVGDRVPLAQLREAVLGLRRGKGMVLDAADPDTWSAGSFFTNPVLTASAAAALPPDAPRYDVGEGLIKTSSAWLVQHAGFERGHGLPGPVSVSTRHTLALTHRGGGTTAALLDLAREVRDGVQAAFGVRLAPEPVLVGCAL